jgi:3-hydroxyacyl-[acyl-carrier-protein] dehydratase
MAQLGGLILLPPGEEGAEGGTDKIFFFGGVDSCRFRKVVVPGDKLVRAPC